MDKLCGIKLATSMRCCLISPNFIPSKKNTSNSLNMIVVFLHQTDYLPNKNLTWCYDLFILPDLNFQWPYRMIVRAEFCFGNQQLKQCSPLIPINKQKCGEWGHFHQLSDIMAIRLFLCFHFLISWNRIVFVHCHHETWGSEPQTSP